MRKLGPALLIGFVAAASVPREAIGDLPTSERGAVCRTAPCSESNATDDAHEYRKTLEAADAYLNTPPVSVARNSAIPPSGDRNDYYSLATYWWPDPDVESGLPYLRRDGHVNPEVRGSEYDYDVKKRFVKRLDAFVKSYRATGEEKYASAALRQLEAWFVDPSTRMNPHLRHAQCVLGRDTGRCFGIIEFSDIDRILKAVQTLREAGRLPRASNATIEAWLTEYTRWLETSDAGKEERNRSNNHGTWYDVQLVSLLVYLGRDSEAAGVLEAAKAKRIATQIEPDGSQPLELARTKSLSYSRMNLRGLERLAAYGESLGIDLWGFQTEDGRSLAAAREYLRTHEVTDWGGVSVPESSTGL